MSFWILSFLVFATILFLKKRKKLLVNIFLALTLLVWLGVGQGWLTYVVSSGLQERTHLHNPPWKSSNRIILLGGGLMRWDDADYLSMPPLIYSRIFEATRLYRSCKSSGGVCSILITGGDPGRNQVPEADIMLRDLIAMGVPPGDIQIEEKSLNTFENAKFTAEILKGKSADYTVLVTSGFHLKRSLKMFSYFGVEAAGAPSDRLSARISVIPKSANFTFLDLALTEYAALLKFHLDNLFGWIKKT